MVKLLINNFSLIFYLTKRIFSVKERVHDCNVREFAIFLTVVAEIHNCATTCTYFCAALQETLRGVFHPFLSISIPLFVIWIILSVRSTLSFLSPEPATHEYLVLRLSNNWTAHQHAWSFHPMQSIAACWCTSFRDFQQSNSARLLTADRQ